MNSSTVEISAPDGVADAYLTRPDDEPHPGVLFVMDAFDIRPAIEEMADRIAADGYVVLAPNVFHRRGRSPVVPVSDVRDQYMSLLQKVRSWMDELTPERLAADGAAYLDYLDDVASAGPVAITGYCMGVRVGWRIAAAHPIASRRSPASTEPASSPTHPTVRTARPATSRPSCTSASPIRTRA